MRNLYKFRELSRWFADRLRTAITDINVPVVDQLVAPKLALPRPRIEVHVEDFEPDLYIEVLNEQHGPVAGFQPLRAWRCNLYVDVISDAADPEAHEDICAAVRVAMMSLAIPLESQPDPWEIISVEYNSETTDFEVEDGWMMTTVQASVVFKVKLQSLLDALGG